MNLNNEIPLYTDITVWTALVTPMLENGAIDFPTLSTLAKNQAQAGNGIVLLGSTGEGIALTADAQFSVVENVSKLRLPTPIMVAVGGYNLPEQLAWVEKCNALNIAAFLLGSPIYAKPGAFGLAEWFSALLEQSKFPCMIYNVPSRSGVNIPISTMKAIQNHRNCWAIKEASGDLNTFLSYKEHCPDVALFSGEDAMMPYLAGADVKGLVSVAANVWPEATHHYVNLSLSGQYQGLFPVWKNAIDALFQVANPITVKVLMQQKSMIKHASLRAPLSEQELSKNHNLLMVDKTINQWLADSQKHSFISKNKSPIGVN